MYVRKLYFDLKWDFKVKSNFIHTNAIQLFKYVKISQRKKRMQYQCIVTKYHAVMY